MALTSKQISEIREELINCKKPLFFFHDDADGLCSFLLLYKFKGEGKGVVLKSQPRVDVKFVRKVEEYCPDKIFITDIAMVDQEFLDKVHVPVIWIDHHEPLQRDKVKYFNPRIADASDNQPATYLCYQVTQDNLWIAAVGCIGDWVYPEFLPKFKEAYPGLVETDSTDPGVILFTTKLGTLVKIFNFVLKGKIGEANKCIKVMTRIESPLEILEETTPQGKFVKKRFDSINDKYEKTVKDIIKTGIKEKMVLYTYQDEKMSFTGEVSNEMLFRYPDKIIIIAREKDGEMRMSLRSKHIQIRDVLKKALVGINGYGGGHEYACGACVKVEDWKKYLENIEAQI